MSLMKSSRMMKEGNFSKKNKTEKELEKFTNLQKCFDSFLKIMSFYHTKICDHEACSQCFL